MTRLNALTRSSGGISTMGKRGGDGTRSGNRGRDSRPEKVPVEATEGYAQKEIDAGISAKDSNDFFISKFGLIGPDGKPKSSAPAVPKTQIAELESAAATNGWTKKDLFQGNKTFTTSKWIKGDTEVTVVTKTDTGKIRNVDLRRKVPGSDFQRETIDMIGPADRDKRKRARNYFKEYGGK